MAYIFHLLLAISDVVELNMKWGFSGSFLYLWTFYFEKEKDPHNRRAFVIHDSVCLGSSE